jgi:hypothetical protein
MARFRVSLVIIWADIVLSGLVPLAFAHDEKEGNKVGVHTEVGQPEPKASNLPTYFALGEHRATIWGHISVMVFAWVFILPIGKILQTHWRLYILLANEDKHQPSCFLSPSLVTRSWFS